MTAEQMQYNFELKLGTFHTLNKIFTSTDIAVFLNRAQDDFIDSKYSKDVLTREAYFEATEKIRSELRPLITYSTIASGSFIAGTVDNSNGITLPSDLLYIIMEQCSISYTDCNGAVQTKTIRVMPIRHDEYLMNIKNPFGKPYDELIWRLDYNGNNVLVHGPNDTIDSYMVFYLKTPTQIDIINGVDCELPEFVHEEIVDRAVQISLASIPQTQNNVEQNQES